MRSVLATCFLVLFTLAPLGVVQAQEHGAPRLDRDAKSPDVLRVGHRLACDCGCPHEPLDVCNCGTAQRYRLEIASLLNSGKSEEEAFQAIVAKYGPGLLREPPDTFVGIFAKRWLPIGLAVIGVGLVGMIVVRWRKKPGPTSGESAPASGDSGDDDEYLARVEKELAQETD